MYQEVLISRAELKQATAQATRKIQTFNNQRKNRNTLTKEINKILSYTFEDFSNMTFLIQNRLLKGQGKTIRTLPREFDSALHSRLLRTIPNGLQKFEAIQPKLQADPALKQKYIQRIKNLDTYKKQKNREKYNRAWKGLQDFLQNPENTTLLNMSGGTRKKKKVLRLKSRRRTHKKI